MINKQGENGVFTSNDIDLGKAFNVFCGIALSNANLFDDTNTMKNRVEGLLNLAMSMSREQSLPLILEQICESAIQLINAERCTVWLMDSTKSRVGSISPDIISEIVDSRLIVNIPNVSADRRFDRSDDQATGFESKSLLAVPILEQEEQTVLGIVQVLNKIPGYDGQVFTDDDERLLIAMASFAGVSIAKLALQTMSAKASAVFDLYHAGLEQKGLVQRQMKLTEADAAFLNSPAADARSVDAHQVLKLIVSCFIHFDLLEKLHIPFVMFFQSMMLFQAITSELPYHNTHHALDTVQSLFCLLHLTGEHKNFDPIELFALLLAAVMHDAGHTGENGGYVAPALVIMFKNQPPTETAHAHSAIQLLTKKTVNICDGFAQADARKFWNLFVQLILSSGVYKQVDFIQLWKSGDLSKLNQMRLLLKIANMSNVARPYEIAMNHAQLLRREREQVLQEEKIQHGSLQGGEGRDLGDVPIEQTELRFAQETVMPLLEIATAKWRQLDVFRQQLMENIRRWKDVVK
jgi:GAF domain-containing protein